MGGGTPLSLSFPERETGKRKVVISHAFTGLWNELFFRLCRFHSSMGTAVSKRKNLRNDAISSVAAKVRAARAFGEYLSHTHPENRNRSDHLLSDTFIGQDSDSPSAGRLQNNNLHPHTCSSPLATPVTDQAPPTKPQTAPASSSKRRVPLERGATVDGTLQPARVYTITGERGMLGVRSSEESLELEVLKGGRDQAQAPPPAPPNPNPQQQPPTARNHHRGNHHHGHHHQGAQPQGSASRQSQPLQSSGSAHNIRDWGGRRQDSREDCSPDCESCTRAPSQSQRSLDLDSSPHDAGKQRKKLERMYSEDQVTGGERDDSANGWFPKENMFSFQTATTTMQAAFRGIAERKRRKREQEAAAVMERNFRKHLRMVGSRRVKVQTFADRRAKSFSRSWSDPTPIKPDSLHNSRDSGDLQASSGTLDEAACEGVDWDEERELERLACEGEDFIPPKIMLISSKVPKAEYVPTIIRRDDPSIIPILYDHEHATFDDILEEIEKKLTAYRKGCKIWRMLIFCQGGPGHLYLLKNKVATFAKVEKEEDMIHFWRKLSRFMSVLNPEPNVIHIMGCYVLGNTNGEKLRTLIWNLSDLWDAQSVWQQLWLRSSGARLRCRGNGDRAERRGGGWCCSEKSQFGCLGDTSQPQWLPLKGQSAVSTELTKMLCTLEHSTQLRQREFALTCQNLFQNLKNLMRPYAIEFKSPLELSAQGKEMIELYFDFRLFRLWKARQHSKMLDYDELL
ncbi:hypothetical protein AAFF_G00064150 [Aldrovandia affinis]|uniref:NMDA receptor synaptonuclear signaling and neuronal migration factor n=1 Tax=Aldrovandia affinis TaxID=143900 RepID=A0AAD7WYG2_9TELE|nr:hypothetical protein AAFF_G00064150 [Aldrovandia affinis]